MNIENDELFWITHIESFKVLVSLVNGCISYKRNGELFQYGLSPFTLVNYVKYSQSRRSLKYLKESVTTKDARPTAIEVSIPRCSSIVLSSKSYLRIERWKLNIVKHVEGIFHRIAKDYEARDRMCRSRSQDASEEFSGYLLTQHSPSQPSYCVVRDESIVFFDTEDDVEPFRSLEITKETSLFESTSSLPSFCLDDEMLACCSDEAKSFWLEELKTIKSYLSASRGVSISRKQATHHQNSRYLSQVDISWSDVLQFSADPYIDSSSDDSGEDNTHPGENQSNRGRDGHSLEKRNSPSISLRQSPTLSSSVQKDDYTAPSPTFRVRDDVSGTLSDDFNEWKQISKSRDQESPKAKNRDKEKTRGWKKRAEEYNLTQRGRTRTGSPNSVENRDRRGTPRNPAGEVPILPTFDSDSDSGSDSELPQGHHKNSGFPHNESRKFKGKSEKSDLFGSDTIDEISEIVESEGSSTSANIGLGTLLLQTKLDEEVERAQGIYRPLDSFKRDTSGQNFTDIYDSRVSGRSPPSKGHSERKRTERVERRLQKLEEKNQELKRDLDEREKTLRLCLEGYVELLNGSYEFFSAHTRLVREYSVLVHKNVKNDASKELYKRNLSYKSILDSSRRLIENVNEQRK